MVKLPTLKSRRHKWMSLDWRGMYVKCRHCGVEVKASQAKRGIGKCPGNNETVKERKQWLN